MNETDRHKQKQRDSHRHTEKHSRDDVTEHASITALDSSWAHVNSNQVTVAKWHAVAMLNSWQVF